MIQKVWKRRALLYWGLIGLVLVVWILVHFVAESKKESLPVEIISSDYRYLIFGSQNSHGIELYDFKLGKFIPFLIPEGDGKNVDVRYVYPVVGKSGVGFCLLEENIFDLKRRKAEVIKFDLRTLQRHPTEIIMKQPYSSKFALSHDEKKLAFVEATSSSGSLILSIYNTGDERIEKTLPVDRLEIPLEIVWKPDNRNIVIWNTLADGPPAIEVNTETGRSSELDNFPLDYKGKYMLAMDGKGESVYVQDLEGGERQIIVKKNATGHGFSLSRDGRYVVLGWLRGLGFETLAIIEISSKRRLDIRLENHPSGVLGLALW